MREFFGGVVAIAEWAELVSDEHFSVDGSLLRAWASHKSMAARDGSDEPPGPDQGRNPEVDFRGKKRSNATHVSRTDPDSRLASKGGGMAFLSDTRSARRSPRHHRPRCPSTAPSTLAWSDPAGAAPPAGSSCACRSRSPSSSAWSAYRRRKDPGQRLPPSARRSSRTDG